MFSKNFCTFFLSFGVALTATCTSFARSIMFCSDGVISVDRPPVPRTDLNMGSISVTTSGADEMMSVSISSRKAASSCCSLFISAATTVSVTDLSSNLCLSSIALSNSWSCKASPVSFAFSASCIFLSRIELSKSRSSLAIILSMARVSCSSSRAVTCSTVAVGGRPRAFVIS